jgi:hypothetical protein
MKACIACRHFRFEPSYAYSEMTAGSESIVCDKQHFYESPKEDMPEFLLAKGMDCPDFDLSALAIAKGWQP